MKESTIFLLLFAMALMLFYSLFSGNKALAITIGIAISVVISHILIHRLGKFENITISCIGIAWIILCILALKTQNITYAIAFVYLSFLFCPEALTKLSIYLDKKNEVKS